MPKLVPNLVPKRDKQELYVAASRSREETFIYATPEIQVHREEIAPARNL